MVNWCNSSGLMDTEGPVHLCVPLKPRVMSLIWYWNLCWAGARRQRRWGWRVASVSWHTKPGCHPRPQHLHLTGFCCPSTASALLVLLAGPTRDPCAESIFPAGCIPLIPPSPASHRALVVPPTAAITCPGVRHVFGGEAKLLLL